jgi:hypothetical protein
MIQLILITEGGFYAEQSQKAGLRTSQLALRLWISELFTVGWIGHFRTTVDKKVGNQLVTKGRITQIPTSYKRWHCTHISASYQRWDYAVHIWLQKVGLLYAVHIWLQKVGLLYAVHIWLQKVGLLYTVHIWLQKVGLCSSHLVTKGGITHFRSSYKRRDYTVQI